MKHTKYKIGVVTNVSGPSMQCLKKVALKYNVTFEQIRFTTLPLSNFSKSPLLDVISSYDIVYYRTGMKGPIVNELSFVLNKKNIPCVNCVSNHPYIHQKIRQALVANRYNIPQPKSLNAPDFNYDTISKELGSTFVVKPDDGSQGNEVSLITSEKELSDFEKNKTKAKYIFQEYIQGADEYRVYTIGGKGIVSYKKIGSKTDFRANLHVGGTITETEPEWGNELLKFGGFISRCFGADLAGVDILKKEGKLYFLELNLQPGWEQLEKLTNFDLGYLTLEYLLLQAHKKQPWYRRLLF